ncbi:hypothetical protein [Empedobacter falsenii]
MANNLIISDPIVIPLKGEWFENAYYVYVVVICYQNEKYYYVGMTGDRKHIMARSPFYRMSGHFQLNNSTQNQIIKGIERVLGVKGSNNEVLKTMNFTYYAWKTNDFSPDITSELHHTNRVIAEKIESQLIKMCQETFGEDKVFNHHVSRKDFKGFEAQSKQIMDQLLAKIELPNDGE